MAENFHKYEKQFPYGVVGKVCEAYPFIEKAKLCSELELVYMRDDFRTISGVMPLLQFLTEQFALHILRMCETVESVSGSSNDNCGS